MRRVVVGSLAAALALATLTGSAAPAPSAAGDPHRPIPPVLRGVTLESVDHLGQVEQALARHGHRPTARIVFQHGTGPGGYARAVRRLHDDADLMGEILDSTAVRRTTVGVSMVREVALMREGSGRKAFRVRVPSACAGGCGG